MDALAPLLALALVAAALLWRRRARGPDARARAQLRAVRASAWERVPLLNREEARLLPALERAAARAGCRVMAQTSLGEVIRPAGGGPGAFAAVNSKRLDFCLVDARGLAACAVEYHGTGHWGPGAAGRDAVKREALARAGVALVEVRPGFRDADVERAVLGALGG